MPNMADGPPHIREDHIPNMADQAVNEFWNRVLGYETERKVMAEIFFGDYSSAQCGVKLDRTVAAIIKATEGTTYHNPCYPQTRDEAHRVGAYVIAYHFLWPGNADAQAEFYVNTRNHGATPVMVDAEVTENGTHASMADIREFIQGVNKRGGRCHLAYIPHWHWQDNLGSADLSWLRSVPARLVSSAYVPYSSGQGWEPYGGMWPQIWQYTNHFNMHGTVCDFNAARMTVKELATMAESGKLPG